MTIPPDAPVTKPLPDRAREAGHDGPVCGVDEAGRGPWAGPVVAAAVILPAEFDPAGIRDSKTLSANQRERLAQRIKASARYGIAIASVAEIDRLNILKASLLAMQRAVFQLGPPAPVHALIDGRQCPALPCSATPVIRGDGSCLAIAAASILAKAHRDALMQQLAAECPAYGWDRNKGYGTREHSAALKIWGVTRHHRTSFAPVRTLLGPES